jgi:hypothetical protein
MASAEECTLKAKAIAIITGALQELQTSKSVFMVFVIYDLRCGHYQQSCGCDCLNCEY